MELDTRRRRMLQASGALAGSSILGIPMAALAQAAKGGVVVIGSTQKPRHLNSAVQSGIATMMPAAQLFATPLRMSADWKPQPYLARKWERSEDGRSLRLFLDPKARFHDGKPITSTDLQYSIEVVKANHPFQSMLAAVNAVTIDDEHTATVRLSQPHPALILAMTTSFMPVIPKHVFDDGTDIKRHERNANPVGSGPFKLVEFKPGEHIIMERFADFFLPDRPLLDRVIIKEYKDTASMLLGLDKGEIDIHSALTNAPEIRRAQGMKNVKVVKGQAPAIGALVWIAFNTANEKLADKRVRQAINYALDKNLVVKTLLGGTHDRSTGPIHSSSPFHTDAVERYDLDLKKAAALLDAAGKKPGADGTRFELEIDAIPGNPELKVIQEYAVPALAKVGIKARVRQSPDFPTWARRVSSHEFEATLDSVWNWGDPVIGVHRTWQTSNIRKGVIWSNTQSYSNEQVDKLIDAAGREDDASKRKAIYAQMQKLVVDDAPVAFVLEYNFHYGIRDQVEQAPDGIWGLISPMTEMRVKKA